jgi:hypothetical protein
MAANTQVESTRRPRTLALAAGGICSALALCMSRTFNGDFYLLLATGRFVSKHGFVYTDPFPTVANGRTWFNQQWLSELIFYWSHRLVGTIGLSILFALTLGAGLVLLFSILRQKGLPLLFVGATLYTGTAMMCIVHPRAAGFTFLAFAVLVSMVLGALRTNSHLLPELPGITRSGLASSPPRWNRLFASPTLWSISLFLLFALWANLHGGFLAGILFLGLVACGLSIDALRQPRIRRAEQLRFLSLYFILGTAIATLATAATPLGPEVYNYVLSFDNSAIELASKEWQPIFQSIPSTFVVFGSCLIVVGIWFCTPRPRQVLSLIVPLVMVITAILSFRNIIFIGPVILFQIGLCRPDVKHAIPRWIVPSLGSCAVAGVLVWAIILGPTRTPPDLRADLINYVVANPPKAGRIATAGGVGSYINWRSPKTPVMINGWLEHFSEQELRASYGVIRGTDRSTQTLDRWKINGVVTKESGAIEGLKAREFRVRYATPDGTYLVRD